MGSDGMAPQCEVEDPSAPLAATNVDTIRGFTTSAGEGRLMAYGSPPNDDKGIEDAQP